MKESLACFHISNSNPQSHVYITANSECHAFAVVAHFLMLKEMEAKPNLMTNEEKPDETLPTTGEEFRGRTVGTIASDRRHLEMVDRVCRRG